MLKKSKQSLSLRSLNLRNIRISTIILFMSLLAVIFTSSVGLLGYWGLKLINSNAESMYESNLVPATIAGDMRANFLSIGIRINKAIYKYNPAYLEDVKNFDKKIQDDIALYMETDIGEDETNWLKLFKQQYGNYMKSWDNISSALSSGQKAPGEDISKCEQLRAIIDMTLLSLSDYNRQMADNSDVDNANIYSGTLKTFLIVLLLAVFIFALVSYLVIKLIKNSSREVIQDLQMAASGDFTAEINTGSSNEFGLMKKALAATLDNISGLLKSIRDVSTNIDGQSENLSAMSQEMSSSSGSVASSIQDVAKGTSSQAQDLIEINTILDRFGNNLDGLIKSIGNVDKNSRGIHSMANENRENMETLVETIQKIGNSFENFMSKISSFSENINQINEITNMINSISDQTNLLALNAAIEAARAGEAGRGFSVVADEIRKLAEQSKSSSEDINSLIGKILDDTNVMVETSDTVSGELNGQTQALNATIDSFKQIIEAVNVIIPEIEAMNNAAASIDGEKNIILDKIAGSSSIAEEISASSEEIAASSEEMNASSEEVASIAQTLASTSKEMLEQVNRFKLQ